VLGEGRSILASLPPYEAIALSVVIAGAILIAVFRTRLRLRFFTSLAVLAALIVFIGRAASYLTPEGDTLARVSPGAGFWLMLFAFALLAADALARLRLPPLLRLAVLGLVAAGLALVVY